MAFLRISHTPAGVPAVYEARLAGVGDIGQDTSVDDVLNALPDIIKSGGTVASSIIRAINPTPVAATAYTTAGTFGGSGMLLLAAGGLLLFALSKKKRR